MKVNEIFYSLQGEGRWSGTPAVFLRLSGCNLSCSFCDTEHYSSQEMDESAIVEEISRYPASHIVITGGEPTLQLTASLLEFLHKIDKFVQIETNGTVAIANELSDKIDWITCSPKDPATVRIPRIDELKVVYFGQDVSVYDEFRITDRNCYYLQPCDVKDLQRNKQILADTIAFIKDHPKWKLSLQTHKIVGIP